MKRNGHKEGKNDLNESHMKTTRWSSTLNTETLGDEWMKYFKNRK